MIKEEWRNINDSYAVSNCGRIKSLERVVVRKNGRPQLEIEKELGYNNGAISACCRCERGHKTYKGFKWSYTNG